MVRGAKAPSSGLTPRRVSASSLLTTVATISSFTSPPSDLRVSEASLPMKLSSSRLRWTTTAVPRPSMCLDPTALPSMETAVGHLADVAVSVAEEVVAADLEVDMAVAVDTEEEEVAEEATTATSVVSPVTWRETVLTAVEVTEEAEATTAEEAAAEVAEAVEAATAVASRDISLGIAPAVDVETNAGPVVERSESVISQVIGSSFRRLLSFYYRLFAYYDGSLSVFVSCFFLIS